MYEYAAKAAGHALRGAAAYFDCGVGLGLTERGPSSSPAGDVAAPTDDVTPKGGLPRSELMRVTLQALVEYRGFRLVAEPYLQLESDIIYGSGDGGVTVYNTDPKFNRYVSGSRWPLVYASTTTHLIISRSTRSRPRYLSGPQHDGAGRKRAPSLRTLCRLPLPPRSGRPRGAQRQGRPVLPSRHSTDVSLRVPASLRPLAAHRCDSVLPHAAPRAPADSQGNAYLCAPSRVLLDSQFRFA